MNTHIYIHMTTDSSAWSFLSFLFLEGILKKHFDSKLQYPPRHSNPITTIVFLIYMVSLNGENIGTYGHTYPGTCEEAAAIARIAHLSTLCRSDCRRLLGRLLGGKPHCFLVVTNTTYLPLLTLNSAHRGYYNLRTYY
jgi:hypothetical protein